MSKINKEIEDLEAEECLRSLTMSEKTLVANSYRLRIPKGLEGMFGFDCYERDLDNDSERGCSLTTFGIVSAVGALIALERSGRR